MKAKCNLLSLALCLVLVLTGNLSALAADFTATGTVLDSSNEPLIGVTVGVKGHPGMRPQPTSTEISH